MDEKKSFFELLTPKSALIVGIVAGVLVIGTVGFIIMLAMKFASATPAVKDTSDQTAQAQQQAQQPQPTAVTKSDRPKVELFVMSYCPFGLQMEKAYLPAWELLKNKADIDVKFVYYSMHGEKEVTENTRQYCIQKDFKDKYIPYLTCFTAKDDFASCLSAVGLTESRLAGCMQTTDKTFKITEKFNDKSSWLSGQFPLYPVYAELNQKYGVQGSPTLIVNGVSVQTARIPDAVKEQICAAFNNPPAECSQKLSTVGVSSGFGTGTDSGAAAANCGS